MVAEANKQKKGTNKKRDTKEILTLTDKEDENMVTSRRHPDPPLGPVPEPPLMPSNLPTYTPPVYDETTTPTVPQLYPKVPPLTLTREPGHDTTAGTRWGEWIIRKASSPKANNSKFKDSQILPRSDLKDTPYADSNLTLFVGGSKKKNPDGKNAAGFAVVTHTKILQAKPLPKHYSAEAAELVAITKTCKLAEDRVFTIFTDSQSQPYMFLPNNGKNRGMLTSTGKEITHKNLILSLLEAIQPL